MTRRKRMERRLELRRDWAQGRTAKAQQRFAAVARIADAIPFGQPILVGHHSEKHARRDAGRIHDGMRAGLDHEKMSAHHAQKASGIEAQLDGSIFSDDPDAIEALQAKLAEMQTRRERMKAINKCLQKGKPGWPERLTAAGIELSERERKDLESVYRHQSYYGLCFPPYALSNLGAEIRRCEKRIEDVKARRKRSELADAAGGMAITGAEYVCVTFAEKPSREIIDALKAANFHWSGGSWRGRRDALPSTLSQAAAA